MKYWSCCRKKTSDFNTFLAQEGCTTGKHMWTKKDALNVHIVFEGEKEFHQNVKLWGVSINESRIFSNTFLKNPICTVKRPYFRNQ